MVKTFIGPKGGQYIMKHGKKKYQFGTYDDELNSATKLQKWWRQQQLHELEDALQQYIIIYRVATAENLRLLQLTGYEKYNLYPNFINDIRMAPISLIQKIRIVNEEANRIYSEVNR